jgi:hypothetical protein
MSNYTHSSFRKGEEFENFVEHRIFEEDNYKLVSRTHNYAQNKIRYVEDSLKPDFKFRCLKTTFEFYVEAKYRSGFDWEDRVEIN